MRRLLFLLTLASLLASCAESESTDQTQANPIQEAVPTNETSTTAPAPAPAPAPAASQPIIEYVWHKKGPDFSEEALNKAITQWNGLMDEGDYQMRFANVLMADEPNENMDFIWSMLWESMDARNAGWQYWQENQASQWAEMTSGLLTYSEEYAYAFAPSVQRNPSLESDSRVFEAQFSFCNFKDGYSGADLEAFQNDYHAWLQAYETDNGATRYWYVNLEPQFEPEPQPDFVWVHLWQDEAEMTTGMTAFEQSTLAETVNTMTSCQNYTFSGQRIRG